MNSFRLSSAVLAASTLVSCSSLNEEENYDTGYAGSYDTSNPYGVPSSDGYQASNVNLPADGNPTYGSAAYEETSSYSPAPAAPAPAPSAPASIASSHTVVRGDTLWGLSRKYNVSVDAIRAANGMAPTDNNIRLGQTVAIPSN